MKKFLLIGVFLVFILIVISALVSERSPSQQREAAEELLLSRIKAQNLARLFDVSQIQLVLDNYFDTNKLYPDTLEEISGTIPKLSQIEISDPEIILYKTTNDGQGYMITLTLKDGRKFQIDESESALQKHNEDAARIPSDVVFPEEQINAIVEQIDTNKTDGWQTYHNEEFGFEFKYPGTWYYGGGSRGDNQFLICLNPAGVAGDCTGLVTISWNVDFEERYSGTKSLFEKYQTEEFEISIAGIKARLLTISGYTKGREGFSRELFFERDGFIYNIALVSGKENVFDQILSTFKFIDTDKTNN